MEEKNTGALTSPNPTQENETFLNPGHRGYFVFFYAVFATAILAGIALVLFSVVTLGYSINVDGLASNSNSNITSTSIDVSACALSITSHNGGKKMKATINGVSVTHTIDLKKQSLTIKTNHTLCRVVISFERNFLPNLTITHSSRKIMQSSGLEKEELTPLSFDNAFLNRVTIKATTFINITNSNITQLKAQSVGDIHLQFSNILSGTVISSIGTIFLQTTKVTKVSSLASAHCIGQTDMYPIVGNVTEFTIGGEDAYIENTLTLNAGGSLQAFHYGPLQNSSLTTSDTSFLFIQAYENGFLSDGYGLSFKNTTVRSIQKSVSDGAEKIEYHIPLAPVYGSDRFFTYSAQKIFYQLSDAFLNAAVLSLLSPITTGIYIPLQTGMCETGKHSVPIYGLPVTTSKFYESLNSIFSSGYTGFTRNPSDFFPVFRYFSGTAERTYDTDTVLIILIVISCFLAAVIGVSVTSLLGNMVHSRRRRFMLAQEALIREEEIEKQVSKDISQDDGLTTKYNGFYAYVSEEVTKLIQAQKIKNENSGVVSGIPIAPIGIPKKNNSVAPGSSDAESAPAQTQTTEIIEVSYLPDPSQAQNPSDFAIAHDFVIDTGKSPGIITRLLRAIEGLKDAPSVEAIWKTFALFAIIPICCLPMIALSFLFENGFDSYNIRIITISLTGFNVLVGFVDFSMTFYKPRITILMKFYFLSFFAVLLVLLVNVCLLFFVAVWVILGISINPTRTIPYAAAIGVTGIHVVTTIRRLDDWKNKILEAFNNALSSALSVVPRGIADTVTQKIDEVRNTVGKSSQGNENSNPNEAPQNILNNIMSQALTVFRDADTINKIGNANYAVVKELLTTTLSMIQNDTPSLVAVSTLLMGPISKALSLGNVGKEAIKLANEVENIFSSVFEETKETFASISGICENFIRNDLLSSLSSILSGGNFARSIFQIIRNSVASLPLPPELQKGVNVFINLIDLPQKDTHSSHINIDSHSQKLLGNLLSTLQTQFSKMKDPNKLLLIIQKIVAFAKDNDNSKMKGIFDTLLNEIMIIQNEDLAELSQFSATSLANQCMKRSLNPSECAHSLVHFIGVLSYFSDDEKMTPELRSLLKAIKSRFRCSCSAKEIGRETNLSRALLAQLNLPTACKHIESFILERWVRSDRLLAISGNIIELMNPIQSKGERIFVTPNKVTVTIPSNIDVVDSLLSLISQASGFENSSDLIHSLSEDNNFSIWREGYLSFGNELVIACVQECLKDVLSAHFHHFCGSILQKFDFGRLEAIVNSKNIADSIVDEATKLLGPENGIPMLDNVLSILFHSAQTEEIRRYITSLTGFDVLKIPQKSQEVLVKSQTLVTVGSQKISSHLVEHIQTNLFSAMFSSYATRKQILIGQNTISFNDQLFYLIMLIARHAKQNDNFSKLILGISKKSIEETTFSLEEILRNIPDSEFMTIISADYKFITLDGNHVSLGKLKRDELEKIMVQIMLDLLQDMTDDIFREFTTTMIDDIEKALLSLPHEETEEELTKYMQDLLTIPVASSVAGWMESLLSQDANQFTPLNLSKKTSSEEMVRLGTTSGTRKTYGQSRKALIEETKGMAQYVKESISVARHFALKCIFKVLRDSGTNFQANVVSTILQPGTTVSQTISAISLHCSSTKIVSGWLFTCAFSKALESFSIPGSFSSSTFIAKIEAFILKVSLPSLKSSLDSAFSFLSNRTSSSLNTPAGTGKAFSLFEQFVTAAMQISSSDDLALYSERISEIQKQLVNEKVKPFIINKLEFANINPLSFVGEMFSGLSNWLKTTPVHFI
eukprot:TRINITY_DN17178_c0_g1_i1.p1 TRINITY_DN17178_c0_g1~~TRINITY_DN17178_c0_g1_i1.p1  ORF type:complete len:1796 (+),score=520.29 TRINITY_DN17178_c0_g1_i1:127-5514(+)